MHLIWYNRWSRKCGRRSCNNHCHFLFGIILKKPRVALSLPLLRGNVGVSIQEPTILTRVSIRKRMLYHGVTQRRRRVARRLLSFQFSVAVFSMSMPEYGCPFLVWRSLLLFCLAKSQRR